MLAAVVGCRMWPIEANCRLAAPQSLGPRGRIWQSRGGLCMDWAKIMNGWNTSSKNQHFFQLATEIVSTKHFPHPFAPFHLPKVLFNDRWPTVCFRLAVAILLYFRVLGHAVDHFCWNLGDTFCRTRHSNPNCYQI